MKKIKNITYRLLYVFGFCMLFTIVGIPIGMFMIYLAEKIGYEETTNFN